MQKRRFGSFTLKSILKKILKTILYGIFLIITILILFEAAYRFYIIDFYRPELKGLNSPQELNAKDDQPTLLLMGDSFTADPNGYAKVLKDSLTNFRVINAGVPGTGIIQTSLLAKKRINRFEPDIMIYQIYLGNDLLDIEHPWNGASISLIRNFYWWVSDGFRSVSFLNFRSAGMRYRYFDDTGSALTPRSDLPFSPRQYNGRQKLFFRAEPKLVEHSAFLTGSRKKDAEKLIGKLEKIVRMTDEDCRVYIVIIPHCIQVNEFYLKNMRAIGARTSADIDILQVEYPFVSYINGALGSQKVKVINTLPVLKNNDEEGRRLFFENDPHLNPYGHQVLGNELLTHLK